jgi:hypothetical protein
MHLLYSTAAGCDQSFAAAPAAHGVLQLIAVTSTSPRQAKIYDVTGGQVVMTLDMAQAAAAAAAAAAAVQGDEAAAGDAGGAVEGAAAGMSQGGRQRSNASACFSHTGGCCVVNQVHLPHVATPSQQVSDTCSLLIAAATQRSCFWQSAATTPCTDYTQLGGLSTTACPWRTTTTANQG